MIKVQSPDPRTKAWDEWKKRCAKKTSETIAAYAQGKRPKVTDLYKKQKKAFLSAFKGKCVFCEKRIASSQHGDVDHFRPKDAALEEDWTAVQYARGGRSGDHQGYYWLAYEPDNLVLCCQLCNQIGGAKEFGKSARFPVDNFRAEEPGEEQHESAKLINPTKDDPRDHIAIDATGVFSVANSSDKGRTTIDVLGLNKRNLEVERAQHYQTMLMNFHAIFSQFPVTGAQQTIAKIKALQASDREFAAVARCACEDWLKSCDQMQNARGG